MIQHPLTKSDGHNDSYEDLLIVRLLEGVSTGRVKNDSEEKVQGIARQ